MRKPNFVLIGAAGFVAPRHMKAIKDVGGNLMAALDPHDNVGVLDSYFPNCSFFTEFERFDRFCTKRCTSEQTKIDWVVICSPNYLHDAHCRFGLRLGADVICEKPLVLKEKNLDGLRKIEESTGKRVFTISQLRLIKPLPVHPACDDVIITKCLMSYITPRGLWYDYSWKGNEEKSGGLLMNIGVHLFDYLVYSFGKPVYHCIDRGSQYPWMVKGFVVFKQQDTKVNFYLSLRGTETYRAISVPGIGVFTFPNITDLHTLSYKRIIKGDGLGIEDIRETIRLCASMRKDFSKR